MTRKNVNGSAKWPGPEAYPAAARKANPIPPNLTVRGYRGYLWNISAAMSLIRDPVPPPVLESHRTTAATLNIFGF